ncbi:MAG: phosphotransferase, partial [Candidatus Taylorbacteria bacterium]|nr:phosphotransferase [Candidatus Taylorbacteria bacterium]
NFEFKKISESETDTGTVLSHGDFNPTNIMITADNKIAFLDFGSMGYRHYLWDVAGFCSHVKFSQDFQSNPDFYSKVSDSFLNAYAKLKDISVGADKNMVMAVYMNYFELLARTHVLVWG